MTQEFVIQPNRSLSEGGRKLFIWGIGLLMAGITLRLAFMGLWLVAPFMVLDLLVLVYAFCVVGRHCRITERVVIKNEALVIHHQEEKNPQKWSFPLHWVNVDLKAGHHPSHGSRLLVGSHGKWIELAGFLTNDERESLASALKKAIGQARQAHWEVA